MKKKHKPKLGPLGIIIAVLLMAFVAIYIVSKSDPSYVPFSNTQNSDLKTYTSQALKISFEYPKDWYVDDRYQMILLTNYQTNQNRNDHPTSIQIELLISIFSGCHRTIEENIKDPACGEGGQSVKDNQILSKEIRETNGGTFYKYIAKTPNEVMLTYYLLEKGDKILQISKKPELSQFENEFDQIINSIEFK